MNSKYSDPVYMTQELIKIPSESSNPIGTYSTSFGEYEVAKYIQQFAKQLRIDTELIEVQPDRPNLYLHIPNSNKPKLVIDNHIDTVSAANMEVPAFSGIIQDNCVWGRGACDVKGAAGALLASLYETIKQGKQLNFDLTIVFTMDEECNMAGAIQAVNHLSKFDLGIAMEPTCFEMIVAHKGVLRFQITAQGKAAHSSMPYLGKNAIYKMMPLIKKLQEYTKELEKIQSKLLGKSTLNVNKIEGGTAFNIIPDKCIIEVDLRFLPEMSLEKIKTNLQEICGKEYHIEFLVEAEALSEKKLNKHGQTFFKIHQQLNVPSSIKGVSFATDCSKIQSLGPCFVWGPGDIRHAHTSKEHIPIEDLYQAKNILNQFLIQK